MKFDFHKKNFFMKLKKNSGMLIFNFLYIIWKKASQQVTIQISCLEINKFCTAILTGTMNKKVASIFLKTPLYKVILFKWLQALPKDMFILPHQVVNFHSFFASSWIRRVCFFTSNRNLIFQIRKHDIL